MLNWIVKNTFFYIQLYLNKLLMFYWIASDISQYLEQFNMLN